MNIVALSDLIAFFGFAGSLIVGMVFATRSASAPKINKTAAVLIILAMFTSAFVMFSNFLEHLGVTSSLDAIEDFVGILFFPLLGYAYYIIWVDQRMKALWGAVASAQAEHQMLLSILDSIQAAAVLVDATGRITYANHYARTILELPLDAGESFMMGYGAIVPVGAPATLGRGVTFDRSVLDRTIENERWEYVVGDVRTNLELSAGPISGGPGRGSVVTFHAVPGRGAGGGGSRGQ
jgi:PAS domain-containing protein